jgi:hypothetical protein
MSDTETSARIVHSTAQEEVKRDNSGLIPRFNKPSVKAKMKAPIPKTHFICSDVMKILYKIISTAV